MLFYITFVKLPLVLVHLQVKGYDARLVSSPHLIVGGVKLVRVSTDVWSTKPMYISGNVMWYVWLKLDA